MTTNSFRMSSQLSLQSHLLLSRSKQYFAVALSGRTVIRSGRTRARLRSRRLVRVARRAWSGSLWSRSIRSPSCSSLCSIAASGSFSPTSRSLFSPPPSPASPSSSSAGSPPLRVSPRVSDAFSPPLCAGLCFATAFPGPSAPSSSRISRSPPCSAESSTPPCSPPWKPSWKPSDGARKRPAFSRFSCPSPRSERFCRVLRWSFRDPRGESRPKWPVT